VAAGLGALLDRRTARRGRRRVALGNQPVDLREARDDRQRAGIEPDGGGRRLVVLEGRLERREDRLLVAGKKRPPHPVELALALGVDATATEPLLLGVVLASVSARRRAARRSAERQNGTPRLASAR